MFKTELIARFNWDREKDEDLFNTYNIATLFFASVGIGEEEYTKLKNLEIYVGDLLNKDKKYKITIEEISK